LLLGASRTPGAAVLALLLTVLLLLAVLLVLLLLVLFLWDALVLLASPGL
jgi:hypothetical protein